MITIKLKTKYVAYATRIASNTMDPILYVHLRGLIFENENMEHEHTLSIPGSGLVNIYRAVSQMPEGIASVMNNEMKAALFPQLVQQSGLTMPQIEAMAATAEANGNELNEAGEVILGIAKIDAENKAAAAQLVQEGLADLKREY